MAWYISIQRYNTYIFHAWLAVHRCKRTGANAQLHDTRRTARRDPLEPALLRQRQVRVALAGGVGAFGGGAQLLEVPPGVVGRLAKAVGKGLVLKQGPPGSAAARFRRRLVEGEASYE